MTSQAFDMVPIQSENDGKVLGVLTEGNIELIIYFTLFFFSILFYYFLYLSLSLSLSLSPSLSLYRQSN